MTKKRKPPARNKTTKTAKGSKASKAKSLRVSKAQAEAVVRRHAERLRQQGAHAISIKPDAGGHVVEVYVPEDFTGTLPSKVGMTVKGKKVDMEVKTTKAPRFVPEKL
jgi:hypothetical protein